MTGPLKICFAATLWGAAGGVGGILVDQGWNPIVISLYRGVLTLVFAVIWCLASRDIRGFTQIRLWGWSSLAGVGVAGAFSFYFLAMQASGVAVAATLLYSAPIFVYLTGLLIGTELLQRSKVVGVTLVFFGVTLLTGVIGQASLAVTPFAVVSGLLAGVFYAAFIFGFREASQIGSIQTVMVVAFAVESLSLLAITGPDAWPAGLSGFDATLILLLGLFGGGLSFLLYIEGMRHTPPTLASLTAMAEPITAALFGLIVLDQLLSCSQAVGAAVIVVTVSCLTARPT